VVPGREEGEGSAFPFTIGAIDGTRTRDIRDHNAALYQLSYDRRMTACEY
jgi:hypothetical protein